ncbi:MAG: hypothetical protein KA314_18300, partial [Chloroflexi bacterium]|nr:hypothetical protein [Chloroflexota bacterium]
KSPGGRFTKSSYKFSSLLVRRRPMGNSYENVGRFGKSPGGRFKKLSYRFSSLLVRPQAHEELLRKCRAIWQIARWTI